MQKKSTQQQKQSFLKRMANSQFTTLIVSFLLLLAVVTLIWWQYFGKHQDSKQASDGLAVAENISGNIGNYLQMSYLEGQNNYLEARQYYGSLSQWLDGDADFRGRAFLGYLYVGDYERAAVFFDTLENVTADNAGPRYPNTGVRSWLGQAGGYGVKPYGDWENLLHAMRLIRAGHAALAREYMENISLDNFVFRYMVPRLAYLTYDNIEDANASRHFSQLEAELLAHSSLLLSYAVMNHDWQEVISYIDETESALPLAAKGYDTQIFYLHALYHSGQKQKALNILDDFADAHNIRSLSYADIRQGIMDDNLQPLPQKLDYYINLQILDLIQQLQSRQIALEESILLARLGLYLTPNQPHFYSAIADITTLKLEENLDDDIDYQDVLTIRESLAQAYQDEGFPRWVKVTNQLSLSSIYSDNAYRSIERKISKDYLKQAVTILQDLQQEYPKIHHFYQQEGNLWRVHQEYKKALRAYNKTFEILPLPDYKPHYPTFEDVKDVMENAEQAAFLQNEAVKQWRPFYRLFYLRGTIYERLKMQDESDKDLLFAVSLRPQDGNILNYLAYGWADRGVNIDEAIYLLQIAVDRERNSGAVIDSLGWAYYKKGDYQLAVSTLELAIQFLPYDVEVNEHLGDVYWQLDYKRQARFQWQRTLELDPDEERVKIIKNKLKNGL